MDVCALIDMCVCTGMGGDSNPSAWQGVWICDEKEGGISRGHCV